jgi:hypothetical protein
MSSGSKNKRRLKKSRLQALPQTKPQAIGLRFLSAAIAVVGFLASAGALWEFYCALTPEVSPTHADRIDPLSPPFRIVNNSYLFELYDVIPTCGIIDLKTANGGGMKGMNLMVAIQNADIPPRKAALYNCSLSSLGNVVSADIVILGVYRLNLPWKLGAYRFPFRSDELHWRIDTAGTPYWTSGTPVE